MLDSFLAGAAVGVSVGIVATLAVMTLRVRRGHSCPMAGQCKHIRERGAANTRLACTVAELETEKQNSWVSQSGRHDGMANTAG